MPNAAAARRARARRARAPARSTSTPPAPASCRRSSLGAAHVESGRAEHVLVDRRRLHQPHHRPRLEADGDAVRRRRRRGRAGAGVRRQRPRRADPAARRRPRPEFLYLPREGGATIEMDGHETFKHAVDRIVGGRRRRRSRPPGSTLADIDLFVYHQANGRILRSVAERLELDPERVVDCIELTGNTSAASVPFALDVARARRAPAGRRARAARRLRRRLHVGRRASSTGDAAMAERRRAEGCALVTGRLARHRRGDRARRWRPTAGRSASATTLGRGARAAVVAEIEAAGGQALALGGDVVDRERSTRSFSSARGALRPRARARQQRRRARRRALAADPGRRLGPRARHQPHRRLPHDAPRAARRCCGRASGGSSTSPRSSACARTRARRTTPPRRPA